jgi:hypothetical protein
LTYPEDEDALQQLRGEFAHIDELEHPEAMPAEPLR